MATEWNFTFFTDVSGHSEPKTMFILLICFDRVTLMGLCSLRMMKLLWTPTVHKRYNGDDDGDYDDNDIKGSLSEMVYFEKVNNEDTPLFLSTVDGLRLREKEVYTFIFHIFKWQLPVDCACREAVRYIFSYQEMPLIRASVKSQPTREDEIIWEAISNWSKTWF